MFIPVLVVYFNKSIYCKTRFATSWKMRTYNKMHSLYFLSTAFGFDVARANGDCVGNNLRNRPFRFKLLSTCEYECQINPECAAFVWKLIPNKKAKCFLKSACDSFTDSDGTHSYRKGETFYIFSGGSRVGAWGHIPPRSLTN